MKIKSAKTSMKTYFKKKEKQNKKEYSMQK